jgi:hypothetical protein
MLSSQTFWTLLLLFCKTLVSFGSKFAVYNDDQRHLYHHLVVCLYIAFLDVPY